MKRRIKHELSSEKPTIWIGKGGITSQVTSEIDRQLNQKEIVKVKILKTALHEEETKTLASKIAHETSATLIEVRGHTFMLYRKRKPKK
ncbi:MAG: YhbY family RNA-binding protein [Candidatus Bathyarchaeia archaeon]